MKCKSMVGHDVDGLAIAKSVAGLTHTQRNRSSKFVVFRRRRGVQRTIDYVNHLGQFWNWGISEYFGVANVMLGTSMY